MKNYTITILVGFNKSQKCKNPCLSTLGVLIFANFATFTKLNRSKTKNCTSNIHMKNNSQKLVPAKVSTPKVSIFNFKCSK